MKRYAALIACLAGLILLVVLLPLFDDAEPRDVALTRAEAKGIADRSARTLGFDPTTAWSNLTWTASALLQKEVQRRPDREKVWGDPILAPRLGSYRIAYYRYNKEKQPPLAVITVGGRYGNVISSRMILRPEEGGGNATEAQLRPAADAFVKSRAFRGAPNPVFESARPTVQRSRTDWVFRYRVPSSPLAPKVVPYLNVFYSGTKFMGWNLTEEYADGSAFSGSNAGDVASTFIRFVALFVMLLVLLIIFLKKYHAGEVGVGASSFLFAAVVALCVLMSLTIRPAASEGFGLGSVDARMTSWAQVGFKFLFFDLPTAVLVFLAWAVGESYARERWGERLASFEAVLRRNAFNATVGRSVLSGILTAPAVAAAAFLVAAIPLLLGIAWPTGGNGEGYVLYLGGPPVLLLTAAMDAVMLPVTAMLFVLAALNRRRMLWLGIVVAIVLAVVGNACEPPIDPVGWRMLFGFGGAAVTVAVFMGFDLLAAATALFGGSLLVSALPLLTVTRGDLRQSLMVVVGVPFATGLLYAVAALSTRREVVYTYEDLAPHVKRIIERERVKAEIDAANRIQAALLPLDAPSVAGASVASHYRAATEIGGDYFDFLPQSSGEVGIAFGDVSGHGLTSGIVMAMAKSALLVQVEYDPSPRTVLSVLNDIVIRTSPKRTLMTFFFGLLDPGAQVLRFSSAGHLDPYVYRAATSKLESLSSWGYPLGIRRREPFREHMVEFAPGDRLILYSDGLIEAVDDDGNPFGFERFERTLSDTGHLGADEIKKALLNAVRKFTRNRPPEDDQTLVVVAFEELSGTALLRADMEVGISETVH